MTCSLTQSLRLLATLSCGALAAWTRLVVNARASSSCRSTRTHGGFIHMAATNLTTPTLLSDLATRLRTSLSSFISVPPTLRDLAASCAVIKLNNAVWKGRRARMMGSASASSLRSNPHRAQRPRRLSPAHRRPTRLPTNSMLSVLPMRENIIAATTHRYVCSFLSHVHGPRHLVAGSTVRREPPH